MTFGQRCLVVRVLEVRDVVRKNDADSLYEVIEERHVEENVEISQ